MARLWGLPPAGPSPALFSVIRRWYRRDKIPIRDISRRTGLSRNTIRKYMRADTV